MKIHPIILSSLIGFALISCKENNSTEVLEVDQEVIMEDTEIESDSVTELSDGSRVPVVIELTDSINMPQQLVEVIENTNGLSPDSILVKKRYKENNITYYELEFKMDGGKSETFTFDEEGKIKSEDKK